MTRKLIIVLLLIVCLPLLLLTWLGTRMVRNEQKVLQQQLRELLADQLNGTDQLVVRYFQKSEADLLRLTVLDDYDTASIRNWLRSQPRLTQLFVLDPDGELLHPSLQEPLNQSERDFLERAATIISDKDLIRAAAIANSGDGKNRGKSTHGWHVWYWGRGVNLIFWRRDETGNVIGAELDRSRWIADLIAQLPQSEAQSDASMPTASSRIQLIDSNGNVVYQWGNYEPPDELAFVEAPVSAPLSSWRLKYFVADQQLQAGAGNSLTINLVGGLILVVIGLTGLAVYFYRESARELREAATRVNFVNQVSHELKTPLTNIRIYADLMQSDVVDMGDLDSEKLLARLNVIVSESQRLSRLIGNVLTFARQQRGQTEIQLAPGVVDDVVRVVLQRFEPAMTKQAIEVSFNAGAPNTALFDRDILEQMLTNLFSNVEKYAAAGKRLEVRSSQNDAEVQILVADSGPGVPEAHRQRVFEPFYRVCDKLESATGAGIGLSIARSLARQHGGDVVLLATEVGACFEITLRAQEVAE